MALTGSCFYNNLVVPNAYVRVENFEFATKFLVKVHVLVYANAAAAVHRGGYLYGDVYVMSYDLESSLNLYKQAYLGLKNGILRTAQTLEPLPADQKDEGRDRITAYVGFEDC